MYHGYSLQPAYPLRERGSGDCDRPYTFGQLPTVHAPGPFTLRQLGRLWIVRMRFHDIVSRLDRRDDTPAESSPAVPGD